MVLKVCDSELDTPRDEWSSLIYSILFHLQIYEDQTLLVCPRTALFLNFAVVKINFRRMAKAVCSTLNWWHCGLVSWKKNLGGIFNLLWDHWVLAKKESQGITEYFSLYLEFPAWQVPGYYLAYNHSVLVSSVCPRFEMIQSFGLVCVKAYSWFKGSKSPIGL